jgi:hypothetical protein
MEFQGLASGDPNIDAHPVRYMTQEGIPFMLVQSFDSVGWLILWAPGPTLIKKHHRQWVFISILQVSSQS